MQVMLTQYMTSVRTVGGAWAALLILGASAGSTWAQQNIPGAAPAPAPGYDHRPAARPSASTPPPRAGDDDRISKCIGADGRVAYMEGPCPQTSKEAPLKKDEPDKSPPFAAEEVLCAVHWHRDKGEFESEIGRVDKSDQVIWNGKEVDMVDMYKRPANSDFNFKRCAKYGYKRPRNLAEFSTDQWTSMASICKIFNPAFLDTVKSELSRIAADGKLSETMRNLSPTSELRGMCAAFRGNFPSAAVFERHLRAISHPIP